MAIFNAHYFDKHEQVVFCFDEKTDLKAIIAIHNTSRGPALGGCRFWPYKSEDDALQDALRLSKGMTYKAAMANISAGGGKGVIIGDPKTEKTPEKLRAFARFVERLNGAYSTGEDMGTNVQDMGVIYEVTRHVRGREVAKGGVGDPSHITAFGVLTGIKACLFHQRASQNLKGVRVGVQGLGHVGMDLVRQLNKAGAIVVAADISTQACEQARSLYGAKIVVPDQICFEDVEVFAPCAMGGVLNDATIPLLKCKIIAGSANNQLAEPRHGRLVAARGILYAPDYVINAGGLIAVAAEGPNYDVNVVMQHVAGIYQTLIEVFEAARMKNVSTSEAADAIARTRFT